MKLFAAVSSITLAVTIAIACRTPSAMGQAVAEPPQATEAKGMTADELSEFPDRLRTRAPETLADVKLLEQRVQELVDKIRPATISMFGGTGVVVGEEGYILSAGHVVLRPGRRIAIRFPDGTRATAVTLGVDDRYDSGMAKIISKEPFPFVEMGKSSDLKQGEWCLAVGFPVTFSRNDTPPVRLGRILSSRRSTLISDCTIMGGDSGGPLFDLDGKVIGINSRVSGSLNQNVHVPVDVFTRDWESLINKEVYDRTGKLKPPPGNRGFMGIAWSRGGTTTTVGQVIRDSAAEKAGLKEGDQILEVAGTRTNEISDVTKRLSSFSAGDKISVKIRRDDKEMKFDLTLGRIP